MTSTQISWASSHDWFHSDNGDGTITVCDRYTTRDGAYHEEIKTFQGSFHELRDWAGY